MIPRFTLSALCLLASLSCVAHAANINGEASYVSFSVPGAVATRPTGINDSMEVTGYYTDLRGIDFGFLREADGTITTFSVPGAQWTDAWAINAAGDVTGIYDGRGFIRFADGRFVTFSAPQGSPGGAEPTSINNFDDVTGIYASHAHLSFTRSGRGVVSVLQAPGGGLTTALGINNSGSVVGYFSYQGGYAGFVAHPDGDWFTLSIPAGPGCTEQTVVNGINAAGTITGWSTNLYNGTSACVENDGRLFVKSPDGDLTFFQPPGHILTFDLLGLSQPVSETGTYITINDAGDIAGSYQDLSASIHGFVRNPYGTLTTFDPPEGQDTFVAGINNGGAIAGFPPPPTSTGTRAPVTRWDSSAYPSGKQLNL